MIEIRNLIYYRNGMNLLHNSRRQLIEKYLTKREQREILHNAILWRLTNEYTSFKLQHSTSVLLNKGHEVTYKTPLLRWNGLNRFQSRSSTLNDCSVNYNYGNLQLH